MSDYSNSAYLTTGQAAVICSVTPDAVLKWIKSGKLPANRTPGGHYRIPRNAVLSIISVDDDFSPKPSEDQPFQYCWEFNAKLGELKEGCRDCIVYRSRAHRCYEMIRLPSAAGHAKLYCDASCEDCKYYQIVKGQSLNLLLVSDKHEMQELLKNGISGIKYNLQFADCEYTCSMLVEEFRPDFGIIDCSMGTDRAREFARHLYADPRIPFVKIILVGERREFPTECDKETFACIERPITDEVLGNLFSNLDRDFETDAPKVV